MGLTFRETIIEIQRNQRRKMLKTLFFAAFVCMTGHLVSGSVSLMCLYCICNVESGCQPLNCSLDVNTYACGYFQIHLDYYKDCYEPKPLSGCNGEEDCWKKCSKDYVCAARCVRAYMRRYENRNGAGSDCESHARLHNGGPNGANVASTLSYWNRVQRCL